AFCFDIAIVSEKVVCSERLLWDGSTTGPELCDDCSFVAVLVWVLRSSLLASFDALSLAAVFVSTVLRLSAFALFSASVLILSFTAVFALFSASLSTWAVFVAVALSVASALAFLEVVTW